MQKGLSETIILVKRPIRAFYLCKGVALMEHKEYSRCNLCSRECGIDRNMNKIGFCGETSRLRVGRAALHFWEEPCISGTGGSGTVFFSGCSLRCCYCQNFNLSRGKEGIETEQQRLSEIFLNLQREGAHNINLVTGEHYAPHIKAAVTTAREKGLNVPVILNSSGYVPLRTLELLKDVIDIYLVDFKYLDSDLAKKYSMAYDYPTTAKAAILKMVELTGTPNFDDKGILKRGVLVRHLCLPSHTDDSKNIIKYIFETYGSKVLLSIMSQYTPHGDCEKFPELKRGLSEEEYNRILDFCLEIGIEDAYIQEGEAASESFIPKFDGEGVAF